MSAENDHERRRMGHAIRQAIDEAGVSDVEVAERYADIINSNGGKISIATAQANISRYCKGNVGASREIIYALEDAIPAPRHGYIEELAGYVEPLDPNDILAAINGTALLDEHWRHAVGMLLAEAIEQSQRPRSRRAPAKTKLARR